MSLFHGFANVWTPIELSSRLKRRPLPLVVAGERVVLFRGGDGKAAALIDRCPHRGVALSGGRVAEDGTIECPFHAWRFDGSGACVEAPLNPKARCERLSATALPAHEAGGLVWIYTAPGARPAEGPYVPPALLDPAFTRSAVVVAWKTHWTRAMENMLDMPHVPYVHRTTIGGATRKKIKPGSEMVVQWQETPQGGLITTTLDGAPGDGHLEFNRPNGMVLHIAGGDGPGRRMVMHVFCVPSGTNETRMFAVTARDFLRRVPLVSAMIGRFNARVALQDQAIIESSDPAEVPPAAEERSVASDRGTLQFRKYYFDVLRGSSATVPPRLVSIGTAA